MLPFGRELDRQAGLGSGIVSEPGLPGSGISSSDTCDLSLFDNLYIIGSRALLSRTNLE